jgi:hypothetical protein
MLNDSKQASDRADLAHATVVTEQYMASPTGNWARFRNAQLTKMRKGAQNYVSAECGGRARLNNMGKPDGSNGE